MNIQQAQNDIKTKADLILELQKQYGYDGIDLLYWSKDSLEAELVYNQNLK